MAPNRFLPILTASHLSRCLFENLNLLDHCFHCHHPRFQFRKCSGPIFPKYCELRLVLACFEWCCRLLQVRRAETYHGQTLLSWTLLRPFCGLSIRKDGLGSRLIADHCQGNKNFPFIANLFFAKFKIILFLPVKGTKENLLIFELKRKDFNSVN